ncbi:MAG: hypothetical protein KatS3mg058_4584 [Roseiflexus sp.]|nr:MAG: hypothetical protein KatS3mg058_4584 [Roseiflexus sp.]
MRAPVPRSHGGHAAARARGFGPPGPHERGRSCCHCETGAAGRSNLVTASRRRRRSNPLADVPGCAVTAPPAQPVEAISSLRDRRSRSKQSRHCETGAAGRSNPLADVPGCAVTAPPAQPVEAISSLRAAAGGEAIPSQTCRCSPSLRDWRSRSKPSRHRATGAAGRSHLVTAPPAQPVEAIPSPLILTRERGDRRRAHHDSEHISSGYVAQSDRSARHR